MGFLFKKPLIYIIIGIVIVIIAVSLLFYSGAFTLKRYKTEFFAISLIPGTVTLGETVTLTIVIHNYENEIKEVEFFINTTSPRVAFSFSNGTSLPEPTKTGDWYNMSYPRKKLMAPDEEWTEELLVVASLGGEKSYTYSIYINLYANSVLTDTEKQSLTVMQ